MIRGTKRIAAIFSVERLLTDGQLVEGKYVEITKFKVYKVLRGKGKM